MAGLGEISRDGLEELQARTETTATQASGLSHHAGDSADVWDSAGRDTRRQGPGTQNCAPGHHRSLETQDRIPGPDARTA